MLVPWIRTRRKQGLPVRHFLPGKPRSVKPPPLPGQDASGPKMNVPLGKQDTQLLASGKGMPRADQSRFILRLGLYLEREYTRHFDFPGSSVNLRPCWQGCSGFFCCKARRCTMAWLRIRLTEEEQRVGNEEWADHR